MLRENLDKDTYAGSCPVISLLSNLRGSVGTKCDALPPPKGKQKRVSCPVQLPFPGYTDFASVQCLRQESSRSNAGSPMATVSRV